ncbi:unnamed protein product [Arabidopsis halleri]
MIMVCHSMYSHVSRYFSCSMFSCSSKVAKRGCGCDF